jgi:hypothetical protein
MRPTGGLTRSTSQLEVSIIRKIFHQQRTFIQRNGCLGLISSTIEFIAALTCSRVAMRSAHVARRATATTTGQTRDLNRLEPDSLKQGRDTSNTSVTPARDRCGSGLLQAFRYSRPCRVESDLAFRRSGRGPLTCRSLCANVPGKPQRCRSTNAQRT